MIDAAWLDVQLFKVGDFSLKLGQLISFFVVLVITAVVSKVLQAGFNRLARQQGNTSHHHLYIISRIIHYLILFVGFIIALTMLGFKVTELAIMASALGIGIGLGLQGMVNNFVSGLMIMFERSLKVGDFIEISSGLVGEVIEINMRATLVRTNDNIDILIPNADLVSGIVTNWTLADNVRRFRIPFSVAYGSDKEVVKTAALEAAKAVNYTLSVPGRQPIVWMTGFGDSAINFTLGVWVSHEQVKRPTALMSDYLWAIDDALRENNIEIPFPQRDLHIRSSEVGFGGSGANQSISSQSSSSDNIKPHDGK
ncbi:mechanosensitive ion channel family protein [Psychrosphaera haliotis]|uniref:Mechanosensitive ion channel n=1 Tax=Psychrosphaera haliotis TaxID=555083 RepID=A0A6N8FCL0_9GAMM|nr:mechanosensitive ion channel domain-containing protein [Psychrosphaera haliotis]MUH72091.1 mechanosensitive ion channel [Psychrosphaera haliotis]